MKEKGKNVKDAGRLFALSGKSGVLGKGALLRPMKGAPRRSLAELSGRLKCKVTVRLSKKVKTRVKVQAGRRQRLRGGNDRESVEQSKKKIRGKRRSNATLKP